MGLREDRERFREVGEQRRQDLSEFVKHGDLRAGDIRVPIKTVDLPDFRYAKPDTGGVGQAGEGGPPEPGEKVGEPEPGEGKGEDGEEAGEGAGEHGYYEMDPEEFAAELDQELGLELEPKGKQVVAETEGDLTDLSRAGPRSALDTDRLFKAGLRRKLATDFDEGYVAEALRIEGWGPEEAFAWARESHVPVSLGWLEARAGDIDDPERWPDVETMETEVERTPTTERVRREGIDHIPFRREDERYRRAETIEERAKNVVVVNIRDVSGSMRAEKRELVERVFTPMDWYLQGKYDRAEFLYIAHDAEAWQVERGDFFGLRSGGGTRVSSAYELAAELLENYPFAEWNRYVFAAGDGENARNDTDGKVVPLMEAIEANLHAYVETKPGGGRSNTHGRRVEAAFADSPADVAVETVRDRGDVLDAIRGILTTESNDD
jgi:uncharacterized sporulation protein YeaH/YhbH (DUF444 family)